MATSETQAEIDEAEVNGWEVKDQRESAVVLTKPSWGSWKLHLVLFLPTLGMGNLAYGVYRRYLRPSRMVLKYESDDDSDNDGGVGEVHGNRSKNVPYRSFNDLDKKTRKNVEPVFIGNEKFILGVRATDAVRKSKKTRWLLTDNRVISVKKGWFSQKVRDIPLSKLSSVEYKQGATVKVSITGSGGVDEEFYTTPDGGLAFTRALRKQLSKD